MPNTMTLISTVTVGAGGAAQMTFNSVPQNYTDLVVKISARSDQSANQGLYVRHNANSSTIYDSRNLYAFPVGFSSAFSGSSTNNSAFLIGYATGSTMTANSFNNIELYIPNYTSANNKSMSGDGVLETNTTGAYDAFMSIDAYLFKSTTAISTVNIYVSTGLLVQNSTASLYGIKSGSGGATVS